MGKDWRDELRDFHGGIAPNKRDMSELQRANAEMVRRAMLGFGPDAYRPDERVGQRLVYNVSSAHVGAVLAGRYLNAYDMTTQIGQRAASPLRQQIDEIVAGIAGSGQTPQSTYYGAVELNGTGIRYFGDFCLVLKPDEKRHDLLLLTNSYDLHREPVKTAVFHADDKARTKAERTAALSEWAGQWPLDAPDMAVLKLAGAVAATRRRLTIGTIAAHVLADEDYLEVPRDGSFGSAEIEEVRLSASDAAAEARISDRIAAGPPPSMVEMLWRHRRRGAEASARSAGIPVRVVATLGRARP